MLSLERPHLTQLRWLTPWALPRVPWSGTSWLSRFLAQQITGVTSFWYRKVQKLCRFERMTSKGTDRLPAMVHRSHRGCVQLQPCWRPGWFQKTLSIKSIIGGSGGHGGLTGRRINCIYTLCSQFLNSQDYTNCIRTEDGFCGIEWKEKSGTSNGEGKMEVHTSACFSSFQA